jgi:hypothetical protein
MPPTVILLIQFVGALQLGQCKWCANLVTGRWWLNRKTSKSLSLKTRGISENLCNSWQKISTAKSGTLRLKYGRIRSTSINLMLMSAFCMAYRDSFANLSV